MEEKEMIIKLLLDNNTKIDTTLISNVINGINNSVFVPVTEISIDGNPVFNSTQGFINQ